jgi:hypothetical protein
VLSASSARLNATIISFVVDQGTANALANIFVDDTIIPGKIRVQVNVVPDPNHSNSVGDLLGVFFNLTPFPLAGLASGNFAGADLTASILALVSLVTVSRTSRGCRYYQWSGWRGGTLRHLPEVSCGEAVGLLEKDLRQSSYSAGFASC